MKKIIWLGVVVVVLVGGYFLYSNSVNTDTEGNNQYSVFSDPETEIQFEYKTEPDGYVVDDLTAFIGEQQEGTEVLKVYRVINAREKIELETSEGGREGPPVITVMVFNNLKNQSASLWVDEFTMFSNVHLLIGDVERDAVVGGANAVRYRTDGLYQNENVVVASGGYIYVFSGAFLEENSTIHNDFRTLVDSVEFIPNVDGETPQAKINIREVCEGALIYMTFPSSVEADAFVEACVEGLHPEVIERYIEDLGLDGSQI